MAPTRSERSRTILLITRAAQDVLVRAPGVSFPEDRSGPRCRHPRDAGVEPLAARNC